MAAAAPAGVPVPSDASRPRTNHANSHSARHRQPELARTCRSSISTIPDVVDPPPRGSVAPGAETNSPLARRESGTREIAVARAANSEPYQEGQQLVAEVRRGTGAAWMGRSGRRRRTISLFRSTNRAGRLNLVALAKPWPGPHLMQPKPPLEQWRILWSLRSIGLSVTELTRFGRAVWRLPDWRVLTLVGLRAHLPLAPTPGHHFQNRPRAVSS